MPTVHYQIAYPEPHRHEFTVVLHVPAPQPDGQILSLPSWIPGSYMIRDFARNIVELRAFSGINAVTLERIDKHSWRAPSGLNTLRVEYRVYAWDLSVRTAYLDQTRAYFNGTSVFLRVHGDENRPCSVDIAPPPALIGCAWTVATALAQQDVDDAGFGRYRANDYAELIDCPVEIGAQQYVDFTVQGVAHRCAVSDGGDFDQRRLASDLARICSYQADMFGELPVSSYLFLILAVAEGYGGLEHMNSTSLVCKRSDLPVPGRDASDKAYRQLLGLCSHEYFHLWNVKRIRPQALAATDLSAEAYTRLLWAFEGITSYYDDLALVRSKCIGVDDYLGLLANTITRLARTPGRLRQSIAESSFDAWTKFYKQDENAPNAIVSYYAKGSLVALGLDITLRIRSNGRCTLDDLMRALWQHYGRDGVGVPEEGIERLATELLGQDLGDFYAAYIHGVEELPLDAWLGAFGIGYRLRGARSLEDSGGVAATVPLDAAPRNALGARFQLATNGLELSQVLRGGAAEQAGLAAGDILVALEGERLTLANLEMLLDRYAPGREVALHYFRRDRLQCASLQIVVMPADTCDLWLLPDSELEAAVAQRRTLWLGLADASV